MAPQVTVSEYGSGFWRSVIWWQSTGFVKSGRSSLRCPEIGVFVAHGVVVHVWLIPGLCNLKFLAQR